MQQALLILNIGSSSLKFAVFAIIQAHENLQPLIRGQIEAITVCPTFTVKDHENRQLFKESYPFAKQISDYQAHSLNILLAWLQRFLQDYQLCAVGHRVVHGGDIFHSPVIIDDQVMAKLNSLMPLAPLHQPYNIAGIAAIFAILPQLLQVACFDTAFHVTQPALAQTVALPENLTPLAIKRYGFHGMSYQYIAEVLPQYLGQLRANGKIIVAHLGYGASLCALKNRQSIATTMGFSTLDGLPMSTRCGSLDPGILLYLLQQGLPLAEVTEILYKKSGLLGLSGISGDVRVLLADSSVEAKHALDFFVYRINRELGSLVAALDGLDDLVFTAGIGENSAAIRARVCQGDWLGIELDAKANEEHQIKISTANSKVAVWVIPTNEEEIMAWQTLRLWQVHIS